MTTDLAPASVPVATPAPAPIPALLDAWRAALSPATRAAYLADLADFAGWVGADDPRAAVTALLSGGKLAAESTVLAYLAALRERGLSPATTARRRAALRSVVAAAHGLGVVTWRLTAPQPPTERPRAYRDVRGPALGGIRAMRTAAAGPTSKARRDVALLGLLYTCGLRASEVCGLDVSDFDGTRLLVRGKGHREKVPVTVPAEVAAEVAAYLDGRGRPATGPLFAACDRAHQGSGGGGRVGHSRGGRSRAHRAGIIAPVSPHRLRHSGATDADQLLGGDVPRLQKWGRWRKADTAMIYRDARRDDAGEVARMLAAALGPAT
jgi:integrase/recombinase XerC